MGDRINNGDAHGMTVGDIMQAFEAEEELQKSDAKPDETTSLHKTDPLSSFGTTNSLQFRAP